MDSDRAYNLRQLSGRLALMVVALGISVLLGWQFDIEFLKRPLPRLVAMNPMTAVGFITAGLSFLSNFFLHKPGINQKLSKTLAVITILIGMLKLTDVMPGLQLGIDQLLFSEKLSKEVGAITNRMAPNTAFNHLVAGTALWLLNVETSGKKMPAQYLALMMGLVSLISIAGYLYSTESYFGIWSYIPMALHTAIGFLILALALLLFHADKGIMASLIRKR